MKRHNHHGHSDGRSWPRCVWIDRSSEGNPDPRADGHVNPCADRNGRADSITHSRAAVADRLVASRGECQRLRGHG